MLIIGLWLAAISGCESPPEGVAEIVIDGPLADQGSRASARGAPNSMRQTLQLLLDLSQDDQVSGVFVRIGPLAGGPARHAEVRDALIRLRESGRTVHCHMENGTNFSYWLAASACEQVSLSPAGSLDFVGLATESYYIRELLESVGALADFLRMGSHKGAAEFLTRDEMSPETRETMDMMLDDFTDLLVQETARGRSLEEAAVRDLLDVGPFDAQRALDSGLIDAIAYHDRALEALQEAIPGEAPLLERYRSRPDPSHRPGLLETLAEPRSTPPRGPRIAVLYLSGAIVGEGSSSSLFGDRISLEATRRALEEIRDEDEIEALVIRIDSPGGSASASDEIWHEVMEIRADRPVIASMGDVAASGGYYIAAGADEIFALPGTLTGSIGVVGGKVVFGDLFDRIGVTPVLLSRGQNAGLTSLSRPFSPSQRRALQGHMRSIYDRFIHCVVEGRGLQEVEVRELATGQVWSGERARELGLIDEIGGLHEAIARARELAELDDNAPVEAFPKPLPLIQQLEQAVSPPSLAQWSGRAALTAGDQELIESAIELGQLMQSEPVLTYWPLHVTIH